MSHDDEVTGDESEIEGTYTTQTAVPSGAVGEATDEFRISLDVSVEDAGPCKKHVRVRVPKEDINHYYRLAVGEMSDSAEVPGFRVGHVPKRLIQRRFRKELYNQVKQQVLIDSLEQLAEDHDLDPINEPDFDVENLEIRGDQDFEYEFEVEVRPSFELPDYEGLTIERPSRDITEADVDSYLTRFLTQYGELLPEDGPAAKEDFVSVSVTFEHGGKRLRGLPDLTVQLKPILRFQDAELEGFDELLLGVKPGESRETELTISLEAEQVELRGETVQAKFSVSAVKRLQMPELTKEFLQRVDVESVDELRGEIRSMLERQMLFQQRQSARAQVLEKITSSADWELPEDLVIRQVENALRREILEMQQAGFTTQEIQARENQLRQHAVSTTRQALKEHFVLDKIGNQDGVEVTPSDIEAEIRLMATQRGESPRRVRARLQKSGLIENLEAQIFERKAIDIVLERAQYKEVPMEPLTEDHVEAVSQSVCGVSAEGSIAGTLAATGDEESAPEDDDSAAGE